MSQPDLPDVRLHQLEGFFHVCDHGSFTRAVKALPYAVTEPALHQQVRKLERALGRPLLVQHSGRRMLPTPEGRELFDFIAPYFRDLPQLLTEISRSRAARLILAAEPLYVEGIAAPALRAASHDNPRVAVRLLERDGSDAATGVASGDIDLAVSGELPKYPAGVAFRPVGHLGLSLLVPGRHAWAKARRIHPGLIEGESFVLYESGTMGRAYTDRALDALQVTVAAIGEASTALGMRSLVRAGVAPAFVPSLRTEKPVKRRACHDGVIEFDVTHLVESVQELPRYGLLERTRPTPGSHVQGLVEQITALGHSGP